MKTLSMHKKIIVVIMTIMLCATTVVQAATPQKIAFVSKEQILMNSKHAKSYQEELKNKFEKKVDALEVKKKKFMAEKETLTRDQDILTEVEYKKKLDKLQESYVKIQEEEEELKEDLERASQKYQKKLEAVVNEVVEKIVKEDAIDIILPTEISIHHNKSNDYTFKVLEMMDKKFKK